MGTPIALLVIVYALIQCAMAPRRSVRSLPKAVWILAIIILPLVGALLWFWLGMPRRGDAERPGRGRGPDDDPDFLRRLEAQRRREGRDRRSGSGDGTPPRGHGRRDEPGA